MKNIVCFDVGGTSIKYAVINSEGEILYKSKFETPQYDCRNTIPEKMVEKINELRKTFQLDSVGISTAGFVDSEKGIIVMANNLSEYAGAKLSEVIRDKTGLNSYVENDVNAVALGEMWKGSAKGYNTFVSIALGTGVGGAIVIDGKVFKGIKGAAGEIGHIIINENGEQCGCGTIGCYERYASTSALIRSYMKVTKENGIEAHDIDGEVIMNLVKQGDVLANKVYEEFIYHVVTGIINITHLLDPGVVIIGGGISAQGEEFIQRITDNFKQRAMKSYSNHTEIIQAKLMNDAGIYGACYGALQAFHI